MLASASQVLPEKEARPANTTPMTFFALLGGETSRGLPVVVLGELHAKKPMWEQWNLAPCDSFSRRWGEGQAWVAKYPRGGFFLGLRFPHGSAPPDPGCSTSSPHWNHLTPYEDLELWAPPLEFDSIFLGVGPTTCISQSSQVILMLLIPSPRGSSFTSCSQCRHLL